MTRIHKNNQETMATVVPAAKRWQQSEGAQHEKHDAGRDVLQRALQGETDGQAGGAEAKPFETFHNALGMPLTLRIATESPGRRALCPPGARRSTGRGGS